MDPTGYFLGCSTTTEIDDWIHSHDPDFVVGVLSVELLGGGNSNIFGIFTPIPGEMIQFH